MLVFSVSTARTLSFQKITQLGVISVIFPSPCYGGLVIKLCLTLERLRTVACQALLSLGFSRQEYWSGLPFSSPGDLPDPGIKPRSPALQADSLLTELQGKPSLLAVVLRSSVPETGTMVSFYLHSYVDTGEGNGSPLHYGGC